MRDNPRIHPNHIDLFHRVFYPIVKVELDMDEKTFGNFDAIEKTVLELIRIGFNTAASVAKLLGVSGLFAQNILNILIGYGHIDASNRITELGEASLASGQKITQVLTKQIVSVDGLNGCPINIAKSVANGEMLDFPPSQKDHILIPCAPETETAAFLQQLNSKKNIEIMCKKRRILNINVTDIREAKLLRTEYASAYLLHLDNVETPIIFVKLYDPSKENFADRFSWQPLSIDDSHRHLFDAPETLTQHTDTVKKTLTNLYTYILENNRKNHSNYLQNNLREELAKHFHFDLSFVRFDYAVPCCTVSWKAITEINQHTLNLLLSFAKYGVHLYTGIQLHGWVVHLVPDASVSPALLQRLNETAAHVPFSQLLEALSAPTNENHDLICQIEAQLNTIKTP